MKSLLALRSVVIFGIIGSVMLYIGYSKFEGTGTEEPIHYKNLSDIKPEGIRWMTIDHCFLDILNGAHDIARFSTSEITECYIPIRSTSSDLKSNYFLLTEDEGHISTYTAWHKMQIDLNARQNKIEMAKADPAFLEFTQKSLTELEEELNNLYNDIEQFKLDHPPIKTSITGLLKSSTEISDEEASLGTGTTHIIVHNASPDTGFYTWFLLITGGFFALLGLFGLIGVLTKK